MESSLRVWNKAHFLIYETVISTRLRTHSTNNCKLLNFPQVDEAGCLLYINFASFCLLQNVKTKKAVEIQLVREQIKWEAYLINSNKMFKIIGQEKTIILS